MLEDITSSREIIHDEIVLPAFEPPSPVFNDIAPQAPSEPSTPAEYFALRFPRCIKKYGPAILERHQVFSDRTAKVTPMSINEDAFAAMLATEECDSTIYHQFELQFYRKGSDGFFNPATEEELKLTLSQLFIDCATTLSCVSLDIQPLFETFRTDEFLDRIIKRAKAVLAVTEEFFSGEGANARNPVTSPQESVRVFVDQRLIEDDPAVLTVKNGYEAYVAFCSENQFPRIHLNQFKVMIAPHIRRKFGKGVRNDLDRYGGDRCLGWRGISLRSPADVVV